MESNSSNLNHRQGDGKNDKARQILGLNPRSNGSSDKAESPHGSGRQDSFDSPQQHQQQRHGGGKILDKVKRRWFSRDGDHDEESPTSPVRGRGLVSLPFAASENNGSSSSIDRVSVSSVDGTRRHRASYGQLPVRNTPAYVLVTKDGRVWILVDITLAETADAVRKQICSNLEIADWETALIYPTELGQIANGKDFWIVERHFLGCFIFADILHR